MATHPLVQAQATPRRDMRYLGACKPGILIVDDEPAVRGLLQAWLPRRGFQVWVAADGAEACELYRQHAAAVDLVLLDVRMPSLDGPQTLAALQALNPTVRCCFMSGHAGGYSETDLLRRGALRVLAKPFALAELGPLLWQLATGTLQRQGA
jgi:CheY-like chemotaxis protein